MYVCMYEYNLGDRSAGPKDHVAPQLLRDMADAIVAIAGVVCQNHRPAPPRASGRDTLARPPTVTCIHTANLVSFPRFRWFFAKVTICSASIDG